MAETAVERITARVAIARLTFLEARPSVLIVFVVRFAVGGLWGAQPDQLSSHLHLVVLGQIAWFAAVWCVYLVNGVSDLPGDRLNGSSRPLASGTLEVGAARAWCVGLVVIALGLGVFLGAEFVSAVALFLLLGAWYSLGRRPAKARALTALAVAAGGCLLTYLGGALAYEGTVEWRVLVYGSAMSLWVLVLGSNKDLGDVAGDTHAGRRTLPMLLGARAAALVVGASATVLSLGGLTLLGLSMELAPLVLLVPCALVILVVSCRVSETSDAAVLRGPYRIFMISQYAINGAALVAAVQRLLA